MESKHLADSIQKIQRALEPYIVQRHEVTRLRRILALHLNSQVNRGEGYHLSYPLSLVESWSNIEPTSSGIRGLQREYIRCLRANFRARKEFEKNSNDHQQEPEVDNQYSSSAQDKSKELNESSVSSEKFLDVVKHRRKYERLRILQDYAEMLSQKPAAALDHLDPKVALRGVESLPEVPVDVMGTTGSRLDPERTDLEELDDQLEKAVLRARLLLKKEQKLLVKAKAAKSTVQGSSTVHGSRLRALGKTRNELINWIETELAKAGDNPIYSRNAMDPEFPEIGGNTFIGNQLISIQRRYGQYTTARRALILAATSKLDPSSPTAIDDKDAKVDKNILPHSNTADHFIYPYLGDLMSILSEQKSMTQQKSHITISLAKHLKEAAQGLDRLADESHLIPVYPMPAVIAQRKGLDAPSSFGDEISSHEKPDSSRWAGTWVFAADSAKAATKDAVSEKLEEGTRNALETRRILLELQSLLGEDSKAANRNSANHANIADIWALLDGNLGVIKRNEMG